MLKGGPVNPTTSNKPEPAISGGHVHAEGTTGAQQPIANTAALPKIRGQDNKSVAVLGMLALALVSLLGVFKVGKTASK
ncbi:MAG: hypothetical protein LKJ69_09840 [Lactobacillus sp.]|nr:hypothetical protein [Lactobacillus sp.]MCI2033662.1 hypothetical protein [Lactobacillus sp.]